MRAIGPFTACVAVALIVSACGGGPRFESPNAAMERSIALDLLLKYDSNQDYALSRAELENALRADFVNLDKNNDGTLEPSEVSTENDRRWRLNGSSSTPLIDWNTDGFVDFAEFTATPQSTFTQIDQDRDGNLSAEELSFPGNGGPAGAIGTGAVRAPLNATGGIRVGG